jgi:hypothetical protein
MLFTAHHALAPTVVTGCYFFRNFASRLGFPTHVPQAAAAASPQAAPAAASASAKVSVLFRPPPRASVSQHMFLRLPLLLESQASPTSSQRRRMAIFHLLKTISQLIRVASTRKMEGKSLQPLTCFLISSIVYRKFVFFSFLTFANSISSPSGRTVLMASAARGQLEVCKKLVSSKCDVNFSSREYAHTPNLFLKCFTKNLFCFHFQLSPSLLPAVKQTIKLH